VAWLEHNLPAVWPAGAAYQTSDAVGGDREWGGQPSD
jgi:hypothetical protein